MRQGNKFSMWVGKNERGENTLLVPLELQEEFEQLFTVCWIVNKDGTYTIVPKQEKF